MESPAAIAVEWAASTASHAVTACYVLHTAICTRVLCASFLCFPCIVWSGIVVHASLRERSLKSRGLAFVSVFKSGMDGKADDDDSDENAVDEEANIGTAKVAQELAKDQSKFRNQFRGKSQPSCADSCACVRNARHCAHTAPSAVVRSMLCRCVLQSPCVPNICARKIKQPATVSCMGPAALLGQPVPLLYFRCCSHFASLFTRSSCPLFCPIRLCVCLSVSVFTTYSMPCALLRLWRLPTSVQCRARSSQLRPC